VGIVNIVVSGGIGNQLFQFSYGVFISKQLGYDVRYDSSPYFLSDVHEGFLLNSFIEHGKKLGCSLSIYKPKTRFHAWVIDYLDRLKIRFPKLFFSNVYVETMPFHYVAPQFYGENFVTLKGYWQSELYFLPVKKLVLDIIRKNLKNVCGECLDGMCAGSDLCDVDRKIESVAIHFRRGDYLSNDILKQYGVMGMDYYSAALKYIGDRVKNPKYYVFSDDVQWVKDNVYFSEKVTYMSSSASSSIVDMYMMSRCDHFIIANSSYSWWAAYLGEYESKIVVCPKKWFVSQDKTPDLVPAGWHQISCSHSCV